MKQDNPPKWLGLTFLITMILLIIVAWKYILAILGSFIILFIVIFLAVILAVLLGRGKDY